MSKKPACVPKNKLRRVSVKMHKVPMGYYGGKQAMLQYLLVIIAEVKHVCYVEPFVGGGAAFWHKEPAFRTILNDNNGLVMTFYEQLQGNHRALNRLVQKSLHSRTKHAVATRICRNPDKYKPIEIAWAVWYSCCMSYMNQLGHTFGTSRNTCRHGHLGTYIDNKKRIFREGDLERRMQNVTLENRDALWVITFYDGKDVLFNVDPPYINTDCGHYKGYGVDDYEALLVLLSTIQGKFILTSYPNQPLEDAVKKYGWHKIDIVQRKCSQVQLGKETLKTECIVTNFETNLEEKEDKHLTLF
jgi:DNA adenine methylase